MQHYYEPNDAWDHDRPAFDQDADRVEHVNCSLGM